MAGRPASTTTKSTKSTTTKTAQDKTIEKLQNENDSIKDELAKTQAQLKELMATIQSTTAQSVVSSDDDVLVVSLTPHTLNLCTEFGGGVIYTFKNMYEEQEITLADLKEIVRVNRNMAQQGRFYIMDEGVVKKLRLTSYYKNLLSPDDLKGILKQDVNHAVEMYKLASEGQKQSIIDMVIDYKFSGGKIDANLLQELGDLCGRDLINLENPMDIPVEE